MAERDTIYIFFSNGERLVIEGDVRLRPQRWYERMLERPIVVRNATLAGGSGVYTHGGS